MVPLGSPVPTFTLPDPSGREWSLAEIRAGRPVLLVVACNHCPYVKHVGPALGELSKRIIATGVAVAAINSNDVESHPDDSPEHMATTAQEWGWDFPYLFDETQEVAKSLRAACTPDFFLYDADGRLAYRGQFDDSRPKNTTPVDGSDLIAAVEAVVGGRDVPEPQKPSMGCNVKWRPGNEPPWFG
jgi:peroxiredoxin